jgi:hypothetical protein
LKLGISDHNNIHLWLDWWQPASILIQKFGFCSVWSNDLAKILGRLANVTVDGKIFVASVEKLLGK